MNNMVSYNCDEFIQELFAKYACKAQYDKFILNEYIRHLYEYEIIFLFGCGKLGRMIYDYLESASALSNKEIYFLDSNHDLDGRIVYKGVYCYGTERIKEFYCKNAIIVIATAKFSLDIVRTIASPNSWHEDAYLPYTTDGIPIDSNFISIFYASYRNIESGRHGFYFANKIKILKAYSLLHDEYSKYIYIQKLYERFSGRINHNDIATYPQYFPGYIRDRLRDDEVFLDCGAYDGDTIRIFLQETNNKFDFIYAFEMDEKIYNHLSSLSLVNNNKIKLFNLGVSDKNIKVKYSVQGCPSYVNVNDDENYSLYAQLETVDSLIEQGIINKKITFVKMDIEGAELDALKGMKKMIQSNMPKLAISVYHRTDDLWEIPLYIKNICPSYKLAMCHHSPYDAETVLYAFLD